MKKTKRVLTIDTARAVGHAVAVCQPAQLSITGLVTVTAFITMDQTIFKGT